MWSGIFVQSIEELMRAIFLHTQVHYYMKKGWSPVICILGRHSAYKKYALVTFQYRRETENPGSLYRLTCVCVVDCTHFQIFDILLNADISPYPSLFTNYTGSVDYFNYLRSSVSQWKQCYVVCSDVGRFFCLLHKLFWICWLL